MKAYTRRRLAAAAKLGAAAIPFYVLQAVVRGTGLTPGLFVIGFGTGFAAGVAELFLLRNWLRGLPFLLHIAVKSLAIVSVLYLTFAMLNVLDVIIDGIGWAAWARALIGTDVIIGLAFGFAVIAFLLFFVHLDRLLGPGVLLGYVTGRYHRPRHENRIFMFLDLKGSTTLAERMPGDVYYEFLHRYFTEMSEPILASNAEIYQYVGDEIVLTWRMEQGIEEANCLRAFFLIEDQIAGARDRFLELYGVVPTFKAGLHAGVVVSAQIGELKKEVIYSGDVLNTTARIQALCNALDERLLVSTDLAERLPPGPDYALRALGPIALRGKELSVALYAVDRAAQPATR